MRGFIGAVLLAFLPLCSSASPNASVVITSGSSVVNRLYRYTDELPAFSSALVISVSDPANDAVCRGGWINKSDAQYPDVLQMVLAAQLAGLRVRLDGDPANLFSGSSDKYCYINLIVIG